MAATDIHHVAIKTADVDATVRFYNEVIGSRSVARPPFDFPGAWLQLGGTMFHIYGGDAAKNGAGTVDRGGAAVDHVALSAKDFAGMKALVAANGLDWRQNDIPSAGLWQLFVHDPSGVLIELNFTIADEPAGTGPDGTNVYEAGQF
jgi:catechol 2,3-dioxygenase-like lactoylglutathione lyase family enzyme